MEVVPIADSREGWDSFARQSDDAWFWHTTHYMDYTEEHSGEKLVDNLSFSVMENKETLALCPVIVESSALAEGVRQYSYSGGPIPVPAMRNGLSPDKRQRVLSIYTRTLESSAGREGVGYASVRVPAVARSYVEHAGPFANPLLRYGYTDLAYLTQVIDLRKDLGDLWSDVRKGHKSDVKRAGEACELKVWDRHTITTPKFQEYRLLHARDAGRVTRSQRTFDLMLSWVKAGHAILVEAEHGGQAISFALVIIFGAGAYYGSSCKDPDHPDIAASHLVQWGAIGWLKEHGYAWYDIGLQQFHPQWHDAASPKDISISEFKRGFGGMTIPLVTAEFFYSKELMKCTYERRCREYVASPGPAVLEKA